MWGIGQFQRLADFFAAGEALGFARFELNHQVNSAMLNGVDLNSCQIVGVHEPCPADISTATLKARDWLISSPDEDCRQQGVRAVQRSIDLAQELGASTIVVHPGRVGVDPQVERELWDLFEAGQAQTPKYNEVQENLVAARAAQVGANLDAVRRSLLELAEYAGQAGVCLALENRYHYLDIPLPDEMDMLLELTNDGQIGFCYDVGHAQALDHLGFGPHEEWLHRFAGQMVEVHLHDIVGLRDHLAPGLGQVDWDMVAHYLLAEVVRTFECRSFNTPQELEAGVKLLAEKGCVRKV